MQAARIFNRFFARRHGGLHRLAFFLTADEVKAEQCFVGGLEESITAIRYSGSGAWPGANGRSFKMHQKIAPIPEQRQQFREDCANPLSASPSKAAGLT